MLILIYGPPHSGKSTSQKYLSTKGFTPIAYHKDIFNDIVLQKGWRNNFVTILPSLDNWNYFRRRPCARLIILVSPSHSLWRTADDDIFLQDVLPIVQNNYTNTCKMLMNYGDIPNLHKNIDICINKIRPDWDTYFMTLANSVSLRSNCMKGRVGCVIVRDTRVVSTGYNGTPTNILNCFEDGCVRCNTNMGRNVGLEYCLCIHAEENALLFVDRNSCVGGVLYSTVFPCQLCCRKIVQMGIVRVVYMEVYSGCDEIVVRVFTEAGIELIKYEPYV